MERKCNKKKQKIITYKGRISDFDSTLLKMKQEIARLNEVVISKSTAFDGKLDL